MPDDTPEGEFVSPKFSSESPSPTPSPSPETRTSSILTLEKALEAGLQSKLDVIRDIVARASKENALESALIKMEKDWEGIDFVVTVQIQARASLAEQKMLRHFLTINSSRRNPFGRLRFRSRLTTAQ